MIIMGLEVSVADGLQTARLGGRLSSDDEISVAGQELLFPWLLNAYPPCNLCVLISSLAYPASCPCAMAQCKLLRSILRLVMRFGSDLVRCPLPFVLRLLSCSPVIASHQAYWPAQKIRRGYSRKKEVEKIWKIRDSLALAPFRGQ